MRHGVWLCLVRPAGARGVLRSPQRGHGQRRNRRPHAVSLGHARGHAAHGRPSPAVRTPPMPVARHRLGPGHCVVGSVQRGRLALGKRRSRGRHGLRRRPVHQPDHRPRAHKALRPHPADDRGGAGPGGKDAAGLRVRPVLGANGPDGALDSRAHPMCGLCAGSPAAHGPQRRRGGRTRGQPRSHQARSPALDPHARDALRGERSSLPPPVW